MLHAHLILCDISCNCCMKKQFLWNLITPVILGENLWNFSICGFLHSHYFICLDANNFISNLFFNPLNICSLVTVQELSHSYRRVVKIIIWHTSVIWWADKILKILNWMVTYISEVYFPFYFIFIATPIT